MRRSNPESFCGGSLDCFAALAMTGAAAFAPLVSRTRRSAQRCGAEPGPRKPYGLLLHGPRLCSAPREARCAASGARAQNPSSYFNPHGARGFAFSRLDSPELCFGRRRRKCRGRREGRVPAGHPRSTVRRLRYKRLHSGIQVKPNIRPSLRSGLTAYVVLSPGERCTIAPVALRMTDARTRSGRHITATLGAQTPGARTTRFCRTQAA